MIFTSGGGGGGITTYANLAAFPASSTDGDVGLALDTNVLYAYDTGTAAWVALSSPPASGGAFGDFGTETGGISVSGATYAANLKVSDIAGTNLASIIVHRHSTTTAPVILGLRSNSDISGHTLISTTQSALSLQGAGWINAEYKLLGSIDIAAGTGAQGASSAPGMIYFKTTKVGEILPTTALHIDESQMAVFYSNVCAYGLSLTTPLAISSGGIGSTAALPGFNNLSPMTTAGDMIFGGVAGSALRFGIGASGTVLTSNGASMVWAAGGGGGLTTVAPVGSSPNDNAATITGATLQLQPADATHPGVVTTGAQNIRGVKSLEGLSVSAIASHSPASVLEAAVDAGIGTIMSTGYGGGGYFLGRRANGTYAGPTIVTTGNVIAQFGGGGYGGTQMTTTARGAMRVLANEGWTDVAQGTLLQFQTTPLGSVTPASVFTLGSDGKANFTAGITAASLNLTTALGIADGGTNNGSLAVTAGGPLFTDGSKVMNAGAGVTGQILSSQGSSAMIWVDKPGPINYILNPAAAVDTSGWALYKDAAGTAPVDGTGNGLSAIITWTRNTTTPLRGAGDFLWTHTATNRQGEGVSYDFTIDVADKAKVLQISFDYYVASGTYASTDTTSDITAWIYDVTNAALIQPAGSLVPNAVGPAKWQGTFQSASNSTSYRLILHASSTTATAYTMEVDNVVVGPQIVTQGAAVTDWVAYTPTIVGFGTPTSVTAEWRRIGDSIEIKGRFQSGTSTAVAASISMPNGYTTDAAKIPNNANVGEWKTNSTATSGFLFTGGVTSNTLSLSIAGGINQNNGNAIAASGGWVIFNSFLIPITGWSSSNILSSDTDTRVVAAIYSTNAGNSYNTEAQVDYEDKVLDTHGAVTTGASWKFSAPVSGVYDITASVYFANASYVVNNTILLNLWKNGSLFKFIAVWKAAASITDLIGSSGSGSLYLNAGDYIDIRVTNNRGSTALHNDGIYNQISIIRRSGPATIAASETVSALYTGAPPTGTLTNAFNITTFGTKVKDSHGAYSSGTYTVPVSGTYSIQASCAHSATYVATSLALVSIFVNGAEAYRGTHNPYGAQVNSVVPTVSVNSVPLLAGALVTIRSYDDATTPTFASSAISSYFSIVRTGNY